MSLIVNTNLDQNPLKDYIESCNVTISFGTNTGTPLKIGDTINFYVSNMFVIPYDTLTNVQLWLGPESYTKDTNRYSLQKLHEILHYNVVRKVQKAIISSLSVEELQIKRQSIKSDLNYKFFIIDVSDKIAFLLNQNTYIKAITYEEMYPIIQNNKEKFTTNNVFFDPNYMQIRNKFNFDILYTEEIWNNFDTFNTFMINNYICALYSDFLQNISTSENLNKLNMSLVLKKNSTFINPQNN